MKEVLFTETAPKAIGPYSQAVQVGNLLFVSGQIPINPATGALVTDTFEAQVSQVLKNIEAILQAAGATFAHVVKTTVFLKDMEKFAAMNAIYARCFPENPPARSTVEVARLPKDVEIEIEVIAHVGK